MPDRTHLSRRALLGALGGIGAGAALGGTGTLAYLHDTESVASTVTAGELDIKLDWRTVYNGHERSKQTTPVDTDGDGTAILTLDDVKPGDWGCIVISIHNDTNPAWLWHRFGLANRDDNGLTEPEETSGDTTGGDGEGELQDHVQLRAFYDDNYDCEWNGRECRISTWRTITDYANMETVAGNGLLLDGLRDPARADYERVTDGDLGGALELSPFFPTAERADALYEKWHDNSYSTPYGQDLLDKQTGTQYLTYQWRLPKTVGNEIQGDSVDLSLTFYAAQARHNGYPKSPWDGNDPDFSVDMVPGVDPGDTGAYYTG